MQFLTRQGLGEKGSGSGGSVKLLWEGPEVQLN